ncbi:MAG: response regulator [Saprospiraceae bacterium]|nr:response regulator [Saprospiraceae bacterium]
MADQLQENPARQAGEEVRLIKRNAKKLLRLVNQLLDLSMLEAGSLSAKYAQADVALQMKYLLESSHSLADAKHISLHYSSDYDELWMDTDPEKLENIVSNLLDNAIKYTPEGGQVRLHLRLLPADNDLGPRLLIQVEDTGIGIPPKYWDQVFNRFYRVGDSHAEGTGIGLAIVRDYVRLLDGHIEFDSKVGEGTTFSVYLPVSNAFPRVIPDPEADAAEETNTPEAPEKAVIGKPHLLIVEDNPDVVHYIENLLRGKYQVQIARDGEEGIGMALELVPDIIISDIMMPKKDGIELCKSIKNDFRTNHIPIILLTAKADIGSRIGGLEAGADAYLAKPFNRQELEVELVRLIRLREMLKQQYRHPITPESNNKPLGLNDRFLRDVHQILERHFHEEEFGIKALYSKLGMSSTQLHRKLTALTGMPASQYIRTFRLEKARELLRNTRMTVSEVAYAVGFADPLYFSRVFTRQFGHSPSESRE